MVKTVAFYCGENERMDDNHVMAASLLGTAMAEHGIKIVYGGTNQGLMGVVANAALRAGGEVVGVTTKAVCPEKNHSGLSALHVVDDLDERKKLMTNLSDASVVLPGGHGTFDELQRELTLVKFGQKNGEAIARKIIVFDPDNFFDGYQKLVAKMGKIKGDNKDSKLYDLVKNDVNAALLKLGLIDQKQYDAKYKHAGAYGTVFISPETIDDYSRPISDSDRTVALKKAWCVAGAGVAAMAVAFTAPISMPIALAVGTTGFFSLAVANEMAVQTISRPAHNPAVAPHHNNI